MMMLMLAENYGELRRALPLCNRYQPEATIIVRFNRQPATSLFLASAAMAP